MAKKRGGGQARKPRQAKKNVKKPIDLSKGGITINHSPCKNCRGIKYYLDYKTGKRTCLSCGWDDGVYIK